MSEEGISVEGKGRENMRKLTLHLLVGLLRKLNPSRVPLGHNFGLPLLLHVGLLELLVLLSEGSNVGP